MAYKRKLFSAIAAGFAVVSFSAFASAQTDSAQPQDSTQRQERREHKGFGRHGGGHRGGKMGMRELSQLNLTDAQKQQIKGIMEANRKNGDLQDFQNVRTIMQAKRDGTITPEQEQTLKNFKQQMHANMEQTHQQILAVLTTEQRAQLDQIKQQRKEQMKQRRQMRKQNGQTQKDGDTIN